MKSSVNTHPMEVALFRFEVIGGLLHVRPGSKEAGRRLREVVERSYSIPGSDRTRVGATTVRRWRTLYEQGGLQALQPQQRSDRGQQRGLTPETAATLLELQAAEPWLSVRDVIRQVRRRGLVDLQEPMAPSTVYRLLRNHGCLSARGASQQAAPPDRRRFAYQEAGELLMSDVMHGPKIRCDPQDKRRRGKTYLICFLDDATRVVTHAEFAFSEGLQDFLAAFKRTLLKRGVPLRFYCDNGSAYRSRQLRLVCADLGIHLIHATARSPEGKGKIERLFRTVRSQLLPTLKDPSRMLLEDLNRHLMDWVERDYHTRPHGGLPDGRSPLQQWARHCKKVREAPSREHLDDLFRMHHKRVVTKDCTVRFQSRLYQVDRSLVGQRVVLRVDPTVPPGRKIPIDHQGERVGWATPLDLYTNARARRTPRPQTPDPDPQPPPSPQAPPATPPIRFSQLDSTLKKRKDPTLP